MSATHDPTNAYAVAGPSRIPAAPPASAYAAAGAGAAPAALPRPDHPGGALRAQPAAGAPPARRPPPARRADGPLIVPTVVAGDGVREVPGAFEHCEVEDLITLIASMLDKLRDHNDRIPLTPNSLTRFHSRAPPNISVRDYLLRIAKFTNVEACCLLILLPYVDKVCARLTTFTVSSLTVHRFIIAAISVGSKALSDAFCTNGRYARVGGVSVVEMNLLEKEFCEALDWRLTTSGPVLAHYYTSLVNAHPNYRLSTAPLPVPPSPPPVEIPPPASPIDPLSPVALSNPPPSLFSVMDMDVDAPNGAAASGASAQPAAPVEHSAPRSTPSPSPGPSLASSSVSPSSGSALSTSASHSAQTSPSRGRTHTREPPPPPGAPVAAPPVREGSFAPPPLIPPTFRTASASHLPSPARGAPPRSHANGVGVSALGLQGAPLAAPAKRARGRSTPAGSPGAAGAEEDGAETRFHPSPRLSNGADTAGRAAMEEGL
ncbi:Pho80p cyclin [Rhodotorula kratochvilovae]